MHFATYGRKSVYSDKSDSVDNQARMCREYVDLRFSGKVDSFECYSDEGLTGANTNRPGLKRLLSDVADGLIDALIVYQLDRLSRDVKDFANIYSSLEEKGVMFISVKESIDTNTPIGKAMMFITATFAQMERETIAARVTDNMTGLARKGFWTGGNPPLGYVRERIEVNGKKHVTIVTEQEGAAYVEWIFDTFLENGHSLQSMETAFKRQGIRTVTGAFFSSTQLHQILVMPYCVEATPEVYDFYSAKGCQMDSDSPRDMWDGSHGVMIYGRSTEKNGKHTKQPPEKWIVCLGYHKPFISADKWLAVQKRFQQNTFNKTMKYDVPLLKGVLRCANCGCLMSVSRKKKKVGVTSHYYCAKRMRQGIDACDMSFVKCEILDNKVLEIFRAIESDPDTILQYTGMNQSQNSASGLKSLEIHANRIRAKIDRLTEALADSAGSTASQYIIAQIEKEDLNLEAVRREIELTKSSIRREKNLVKTAEDCAAEVSRLIRGLTVFSDKERNEIVREVVSECRWDGDTLFLRF